MTNKIKVFLVTALFAAIFSFVPGADKAKAQTPQACQWNYQVIAGVATATYCGNAVVAGNMSVNVSAYIDASTFAGVDPSGINDSTTGLLSAWSQMLSTGKMLMLPCGTYKISGSGTEVFLATNLPINIMAPTKGCVFIDTTNVGSSTIVFHHVLTTGVVGTYIANLTVNFPTPVGASSPYKLDVTATGYLLSPLIFNNNFNAVEANGPSIYVNGVNTLPNGAIVNGKIEFNGLNQFKCVYCGDGNALRDNRIQGLTGSLVGVDASFVSGAAGFVADHNLIASHAGAFRFHNGVYPVVINNEIETLPVADTSAHNALIDFDGDISLIYGGKIDNNSVSSLSGAGNPGPNLIRLNNVGKVDIPGNRLSTYYPGAFHYLFTASATAPHIGAGNKYETIFNGSTVPYISNSSGFNLECAPNFNAPSTSSLVHGDPVLGCGVVGPLLLSELPSPVSQMAVNSAPSSLTGFCTASFGIATNTTSFTIVTGVGTCGSTGGFTMPSSPWGNGWNCFAQISALSNSHILRMSNNSATSVQFTDYTVAGVAQNFPASNTLAVNCTPF